MTIMHMSVDEETLLFLSNIGLMEIDSDGAALIACQLSDGSIRPLILGVVAGFDIADFQKKLSNCKRTGLDQGSRKVAIDHDRDPVEISDSKFVQAEIDDTEQFLRELLDPEITSDSTTDNSEESVITDEEDDIDYEYDDIGFD